MKTGLDRGVVAALGAALLFGAGTPFAKLLLSHTDPWLLAALLYLRPLRCYGQAFWSRIGPASRKAFRAATTTLE